MIETLIAVLVIAVAYGALMTVVAILNRKELQKWVNLADEYEKENKERLKRDEELIDFLKKGGWI